MIRVTVFIKAGVDHSAHLLKALYVSWSKTTKVT